MSAKDHLARLSLAEFYASFMQLLNARANRTPTPQQQLEALLVREDGLELVGGLILDEMRNHPMPNGVRYQRMIKNALRWKREQLLQPLAMSE